MDKIASPQDLASEIQLLIKYAGSENPSRSKLAQQLRGLADRVAGKSLEWNLQVLRIDFLKDVLKKVDAVIERRPEFKTDLWDTLLEIKNTDYRGDFDPAANLSFDIEDDNGKTQIVWDDRQGDSRYYGFLDVSKMDEAKAAKEISDSSLRWLLQK